MSGEDHGHGHGGAGGEDLKRSITLFQLVALGIGCTVGTGIFFVLTETVPKAGPAVVAAFVIAGIVAGLTAICYAEMSSMIPVSGSTYSYAYATLGEIVAFVVAACLMLEYGIAGSAVAVGWSDYLNKLFEVLFGVSLPAALSHGPIEFKDHVLSWSETGIINLPAVIVVMMCTLLLARGAQESARVNAIMVVIKLGILLMFCAIAFTGFNSSNFVPFAPHGMTGINAAAATIFFSYVGLDAVSTAGEEVENPRRNLPLAIMLSLVVVTTVYVLVAFAAMGAQPAAEFEGQSAGLATILEKVTGSTIPSGILSAGAVISVFSVTLVILYGQTRILFVMSRDGLVPARFHLLDDKTKAPRKNTFTVGILVALVAAFVPSAILWDMVSMGTLVAFMVVSAGVIILRYSYPDMPRGFKVPLFPYLPILSMASCLYLIFSLPKLVYILTSIWLVLSLTVYFIYSIRNSRLEDAT
ncbi:MAG: amino acid permease [Paracoccus sp. (in: a-proteobacteria)]|uniref:APC family permease n=1 Tax=Paracoccus sp. TaxID=267 RepID=UPI0039E64C8A